MKYQRKNHGAKMINPPMPRTIFITAPKIPVFSSRKKEKSPIGIMGKKNQTHSVPNANRAKRGNFLAAFSAHASWWVKRSFIE